MLIDLSATDVSGKDLEEALGHCEITVNKNTVPQEKRSPFVTSGVRIGTPAVTTRGLGLEDMATIARWIKRALDGRNDQTKLKAIKGEVMALAGRYPLYREWT
jgi:glycine hydroxymethyltransferase